MCRLASCVVGNVKKDAPCFCSAVDSRILSHIYCEAVCCRVMFVQTCWCVTTHRCIPEGGGLCMRLVRVRISLLYVYCIVERRFNAETCEKSEPLWTVWKLYQLTSSISRLFVRYHATGVPAFTSCIRNSAHGSCLCQMLRDVCWCCVFSPLVLTVNAGALLELY